MAPEYTYSVEMQAEGGRWVRLASFERPLDADRLFELLISAGAVRPLQVTRYAVVVRYDPRQGA